MRISDWSSDVGSSDLPRADFFKTGQARRGTFHNGALLLVRESKSLALTGDMHERRTQRKQPRLQDPRPVAGRLGPQGTGHRRARDAGPDLDPQEARSHVSVEGRERDRLDDRTRGGEGKSVAVGVTYVGGGAIKKKK